VPGTWTGWHTDGWEWTSATTRYYCDGKLVGSVPAGVRAPHFLILTTTTGTYGGRVVAPANVQVDYVPVWQR
jgi:beta-glucanase (GH16 family)